jgi:hypothetical protein
MKSVYTQPISKERVAKYSKVFEHLTIVKQSGEPSESAGSRFSYSTRLNSHFIARKQQETEDFIDQCLEEYITWIAQEEVKKSKRLLATTERHVPLPNPHHHDEEATTEP